VPPASCGGLGWAGQDARAIEQRLGCGAEAGEFGVGGPGLGGEDAVESLACWQGADGFAQAAPDAVADDGVAQALAGHESEAVVVVVSWQSSQYQKVVTPGPSPGENGVEVFAVAEPDLPGQAQRGPPIYGPPAGSLGAGRADQTESRHLPLRVRRFRMALPVLVRLRCMKPCRRARRLFFG